MILTEPLITKGLHLLLIGKIVWREKTGKKGINLIRDMMSYTRTTHPNNKSSVNWETASCFHITTSTVNSLNLQVYFKSIFACERGLFFFDLDICVHAAHMCI